MANGNLNSLFNAVSLHVNVGTWEEFSAKMQTPEDRRSFFDAVSTHINIGDYREFESKLRKATGDEVDVGPIELPQVDVEGSKEEDTWIERTLGKNIATDFLGDLWRAKEQGFAQGATVDEAFDVYKKGKNISDEELRRYIEVSDALDKTGASDEMREYEEIKNKAGGGVWGFMKGMIQTRGQVIPQVIVSSAAAMARTFFDSEEAALATGTGAALAGTAGSFVPVVGTVTGAIGGAVGGLVGSM